MQSDQLKRRDFITLVGGAAAAWPLAARAQQPLMPVVGWLGSGSAEPLLIAALHRGLREAGFIDGRNVAFEYRWANGEYERLPAQVAELVERRVAVIVAGAPPAAHAAKAATSTIPVVFSLGTDPVKTGLVESLNRPGGNLTGITQFSTELEAKRLEILRESVPNANLIALLVNPNFLASKSLVDEVQDAARVLAQQILVLNASNEREVEIAFAMLVQQRANALLVGADPSRFNQRQQFVELAARYTVPAIYPWREFVAIGGLMSYGTNLSDSYYQAGLYTGRILTGTKPADLPVQQSTRVELVINLKTAKTLGLTFPISLLGRADEVIE
jgi:putative tryptophan/tyrosine transport system substrate-binding protein